MNALEVQLPAAGQYCRAVVSAITDETASARSFVLDFPTDRVDSFRYRAGQFITVRVTIDGEQHLRCYSMSSAPATDDELRITVKRQEGGLVSTWLTTAVRAGDELEVLAPAGNFTLRPGDDDVVLFASGSGITPVLSLIKTLLQTTHRKVRLLYGNQNRDTVIFHDELASLVGMHRNRFTVTHHLYDERGYVTPKDVGDFFVGSATPSVYVCGAPEFAATVLDQLCAAGHPGERTFVESFATDRTVTADQAARFVAPTIVTDELVLKLRGRRHTLPYTPGDTILETGRRAQLSPPFSCESGTCASCMAFVKKGDVVMAFNSALSAEEVAEGWVLTCQGYPASERVVIEYPE